MVVLGITLLYIVMVSIFTQTKNYVYQQCKNRWNRPLARNFKDFRFISHDFLLSNLGGSLRGTPECIADTERGKLYMLGHCCHAVVTLLLHCCSTVGTLFPHCCYILVTPVVTLWSGPAVDGRLRFRCFLRGSLRTAGGGYLHQGTL
jgi:hypothetical protein